MAEGSASGVIGSGPGQCVVCGELEAMAHALAEAEIEAVIMRTANRFVVANAGQYRLPCRRKRRRKRASAANPIHRHLLVDVDGLVFVQAENVCVLRLERRV